MKSVRCQDKSSIPKALTSVASRGEILMVCSSPLPDGVKPT